MHFGLFWDVQISHKHRVCWQASCCSEPTQLAECALPAMMPLRAACCGDLVHGVVRLSPEWDWPLGMSWEEVLGGGKHAHKMWEFGEMILYKLFDFSGLW